MSPEAPRPQTPARVCVRACVQCHRARESSFCMSAALSGDVLSLRYFNNAFISSTWKPWQRALMCLHTLPTSRVPSGCIGTCGFGHNGCLSFCFRVQHVLLSLFLFFCRVKTLALTRRPVTPRMGCITCSDDYILAFHSDLLFQAFATRSFWAECEAGVKECSDSD